MSDLVRRYLAQQIELGGAELVLPPGARLPDARAAAEPAPPDEPVPPARPVTVAPGAPPEPAAPPGEARWRKGAPPVPGPGLSVTSPALDLLGAGPSPDTLDAVARLVAACTRCELCRGRTNTVPGEGNPAARLLCVGEGPGQTEDETGRPFVGRAGELLTQMLAAIDLPRESVFIANIVKCRPPNNRKPTPEEMQACLPYLRQQISLIRPTVILALGATAAEGLLNIRKSLTELRGKVHRYDGVPLIVTYHPAALLRNPNWKKPAWDDVRIARQLVDR